MPPQVKENLCAGRFRQERIERNTVRYFEGFRCGNCEREVPAGTAAGECPSCSGPLLAVYDLGIMKRNVTREEFYGPGEGIWRFRDLLPAYTNEITLGEGNTPLLEAPALASSSGCGPLYIKNEALNPTGSFKARGMAAAVSRLVDLGARVGVIPSAGNAGLALAAYGAAAGLAARIYIPSVTPEGCEEECAAYGADVRTIEGILPDAARAMADDGFEEGEFAISTFREPARVEGKKTMAFEIEDDLDGQTPRWIIFPTGGGTGVVAFWKAYLELEQLGWLAGEKPRIVVVQSEGCAPVVKAFEAGAETMETWVDPVTIASGIRVPGSRADRQVLRALYETGGTAVAVSDKSIIDAAYAMARGAGIFPSPEGAATLAGLVKLTAAGTIGPEDPVVIVNTADWTRYRFMLER
jgi:threonine synthase